MSRNTMIDKMDLNMVCLTRSGLKVNYFLIPSIWTIITLLGVETNLHFFQYYVVIHFLILRRENNEINQKNNDFGYVCSWF